MRRETRTFLDLNLATVRRTVLALGKYGNRSEYYERELAILENTARKIRIRLESDRIQGRLFETETGADASATH